MVEKRDFNCWSYQLPKPKRDIRHLCQGFESLKEMREERNLRVKVLRARNPESKLALTLRECKSAQRCINPACPICMRRFRRWFVGQSLSLFQDYTDLIFITLIPPKIAVSRKGLRSTSPRRIFDRLRKQLSRVKCRWPVVGSIDGSYEMRAGTWQPHLHLVAPASARASFEAIRSLYPKTITGSAGLVIDKVKRAATDRPRVLSYCCKGFWQERRLYTDGAGKGRVKNVRLNAARQREWLNWLGLLRQTELIFLYGVRREKDRLIKKAPSSD